MANNLLTLTSISKSFGSSEMPSQVLDQIQMSIKENEFVTILGRSGCGKSTLLRIIAGLIEPNSGEILYQNKKFTRDSPRLAMVFQSHALFPWLNVLENVELGLEALGFTHAQRRRRALEAIDLIGLDGYESAYPKELSGGMRQRVGFARALVVNPDILLLDEPFSALDVLTADNIRNELMELWIEKHIPTKAIIMVSHNVAEAVELSNRLIILNHDPGRIVKEIDISLIYPRDETSQHFQTIVDDVYTTLMATAEHPASLKKGEKAKRVIGIDYRLPDVSIQMFQGLMDSLLEAPYHGKADIFALADSESLSVTDSLPLFEAIEFLGFAQISKGDIELTNSGKALCQADILERKKIFAYHLMRHVPLAKHIYHALQDTPRNRVTKEKFLREMEGLMPLDEAEENISIVIDWGRYAELFAYDSQTEILSLENPQAEEHALG
ncbi:Nitrate/sulfonate/bicarbonate ABC transporter ATP-binding protein [Candidatus Bealeia paramacronuclearis]|uniref:Nitrate/sulfonate/bicarbonate ABC transporter ATP-binding protein n=1 Tax=Candidatus Bealeia paramacronuclearis TaxID=1921001 RepID=A0ABZ2C1G3_9PROT|nr:Nitrate/sulfonate/bicarbonate ABC transporter ATP-binding protein [Candidatus Bealeia paramacronuclearis]